MNLYTSDLHFGHANVIRFDHRPFLDVDEMDRFLIQMWNHRVQPDDHVYILGDVCYRNTKPEEWYLRQLSGHKHLIIGNHDNADTVAALRNMFEDIAEYREINDSGRQVVLCHYPILGFHDHYFGWTHLYGHLHASFEWNVTEHAKRLLKKLYVRDDICRMANIGAMLPYMDYTPRSLEELAAQL